MFQETQTMLVMYSAPRWRPATETEALPWSTGPSLDPRNWWASDPGATCPVAMPNGPRSTPLCRPTWDGSIKWSPLTTSWTETSEEWRSEDLCVIRQINTASNRILSRNLLTPIENRVLLPDKLTADCPKSSLLSTIADQPLIYDSQCKCWVSAAGIPVRCLWDSRLKAMLYVEALHK